MRKFVKGKLETVVEDNDRRIPDYLANGWKETTPKAPTDEGEKSATDKALQDVVNSEGGNEPPKGKGKGGKAGKPDKPNENDQKVNDAINANSTAAAESEAVDDGLETNSTDESSEPNENKGGD